MPKSDTHNGRNVNSHHPAIKDFSGRLRELLATHATRSLETGRSRRANPKSLSEILSDQTNGQGVRGLSQSQLYRLEHGSASPNIEVVYEIAKAFRVSPRSFLSDNIANNQQAIQHTQ